MRTHTLEQQVAENDEELNRLRDYESIMKAFFSIHHSRFNIITVAVDSLTSTKNVSIFFNAFQELAMDYNRAADEEEIARQRHFNSIF